MTNAIDKLKSELEALPIAQRAELAEFLLHSLDEEEDEGVEPAWDVELKSRLGEIESGQAVGIPTEQLLERLRKKYS